MPDYKNIHEEIIEYLKNSISPVTAHTISTALGIPTVHIERVLDELQMGGKVKKFTSNKQNGTNRVYYAIPDSNVYSNLGDSGDSIEVIQQTVNVKDGYENLSNKIEKIDKNVNGLYANIISIMSIFVGIFALIAVNANIAFEITEENIRDVFLGIICTNIFVVICIIILLLGVKFIIINPLLGKNE